MSDYKPTTEDMERAWAFWRKPVLERKDYFPDEKALFEVTNAEFDRWLATVKADALREAADKLDHKYQPADVDERGPHIGFYGEAAWLCELANEIEQEQDR